MRTFVLLCILGCVVKPALAGENKEGLPRPVRITTGVSGHIHPSLCITKSGTLVGTWCQSEGRDMHVVRSTDGGKTWSKPILFDRSVKGNGTLYPGSLTVLPDGRIVHAWNVWYPVAPKKKLRHVTYSISADEGKTWSETKDVAKSDKDSVIRHPFVFLAEDAWLLPLYDRTVVFNPMTGKDVPFGDGKAHGLVPIVRTPKGTFVSGDGLRSTDMGKTWTKITPFPDIKSQGWRHDMMCLDNGWLLASQVVGPGVGGNLWQYVVSKDDGLTWSLKEAATFYEPGRAIGGRACPKTVQVDAETIGTLFYDDLKTQPGGSGLFFLRFPLAGLSTGRK